MECVCDNQCVSNMSLILHRPLFILPEETKNERSEQTCKTKNTWSVRLTLLHDLSVSHIQPKPKRLHRWIVPCSGSPLLASSSKNGANLRIWQMAIDPCDFSIRWQNKFNKEQHHAVVHGELWVENEWVYFMSINMWFHTWVIRACFTSSIL